MTPSILTLGAVASASTPAGHGAPATEGGHAAEGGHGGHHYYTDDDDHDGVANWMDSTTGSAPNTETYVLQPVALHAFNLFVLLAILVWAVRKPFGDFWRERAHDIRKELTDAATRRDEAQRRQQEVLDRLARIDGEITAMQQQATADARAEEEQLVERARREAARVAEQAERNVRDEVVRARAALRAEAVELAVRLAETTLRAHTSNADQQALARAFLKSVDEGEQRV